MRLGWRDTSFLVHFLCANSRKDNQAGKSADREVLSTVVRR